MRQRTHCKRGHPFDTQNTYIRPNGKRNCRTCHVADDRRRRAKEPRQVRNFRSLTTAADRLLARAIGIIATGCWEWTGATARGGYGSQWWDGKLHRAHRLSYEVFVGPIPEGLTLDHLCRNKACIRPSHLEPVTNDENVKRGFEAVVAERQTCGKGHAWTPENTYHNPGGGRRCRACLRIDDKRYRERHAAA